MGSAVDGRLGSGGPVGIPTPALSGVAKVAAGLFHSVILKADGTVWTAGANHRGQLGDPGTPWVRSEPVQIATDAIDVAAGQDHTLYLLRDGTLWGVGANQAGQLGDGTVAERRIAVQIAAEVKAVAAGSGHTVFLRRDGVLFGMGGNSSGQLAQPGTSIPVMRPVQIADEVTRVVAGGALTLYWRGERSLYSVGADGFPRNSPHVPNLVSTDAVAAAAGSGFTLFVKTDRTLWGVGHNYGGELGDGTLLLRTTPVRIATDVIAVSASDSNSAFLRTDGSLWTTGYNAQGQLGDGTAVRRTTPARVGSDVAFVSLGGYTTLFVLKNGTLMATGSNLYGAFGNGMSEERLAPLLVARSVTKVVTSANASHTVFLTADGQLWGMGDNTHGQLGNSSSTRFTAPVLVAPEAVDAAVGDKHTFYRTRDGTLWGVGANRFGQLGDGTNVSTSVPIMVANNVVSFAAGDEHSIYALADGTVRIMGNRAYEGTFLGLAPRQLEIPGVIAVAAGSSHGACLDAEGRAWTYGANLAGELGTGVPRPEVVPRQVADQVRAIMAGGTRTFFLKNDGSLWGTGSSSWGQLGARTLGSVQSPIPVTGGVRNVWTGVRHTLFLKNDGTLLASGLLAQGGFDFNEYAGSVSLYFLTDLGFVDGRGAYIAETVGVATGVTGAAAGDRVSYYIQAPAAGLPPTITTEPQPVEFVPGARIRLAVAATGMSPIDYRWRRNGVDIIGGRGPMLVIPVGQLADVGEYDVVLTNAAGTTATRTVPVTVHVATITQQPPPVVTLEPGAPLHLVVSARSSEPLKYQWFKDGAMIAGATEPAFALGAAQERDSGIYRLQITSPWGTISSAPIQVTVAPPVSRIVNLSVRTMADGDDRMLIAGFAVGGRGLDGSARVLVRGVGPSLGAFGVDDALADPAIALMQGSLAVAENDDWAGDPAIAAATASAGAFALSGDRSKDAALIASLAGEAFTVQLRTPPGPPANGLVEIYDVSDPARYGSTRRLLNVSARARAGGESGVLTVGFVIRGAAPKGILIRGTGPGLGQFGVTEVMADPKLHVLAAGSREITAANDDWGGSAGLAAAFAQVGAFPLDPASRDAALQLRLPPGSYIVELSGVGGSTGRALIEVYDLDP